MSPGRRLALPVSLGVVSVAAALWLPGPFAPAVVGGAFLAALAWLWRSTGSASAAALPRTANEDAVVDSTRDLVRLLDVLNEGVLLLDAGQVVLAANEASARMMRRPPGRMVGLSLIRATRDHELVQLLRESSGQLREVTLSDGRRVLASATPFTLGPVRTLLTLQDVTALRHAERARQDLVANVSHELRTPIAAALALAETLEAGVNEEEQAAHFHRRLTAELERLAELVEQLLRLSRIESQAEQFRIETVAAETLLQQTIDHMTPLAARAGVDLVAAPVPAGLAVRADRARVVEVLTNLVDNAVRFSPPRESVTLAAEPDGGMVRFSVRDRGPGILPSERRRVFERFYRGEGSRTTGEGRAGTGLGLAIARHIVSRLGGEIWVGEETPGATLRFTLPAAPAPAAAPVPAASSSGLARAEGDPP